MNLLVKSSHDEPARKSVSRFSLRYQGLTAIETCEDLSASSGEVSRLGGFFSALPKVPQVRKHLPNAMICHDFD